ncbi:uncharacterized protein LOC115334980 isoform X3 [Aquila chrysaetos chrysaetos]|uniref:uncharacterized protein LOC115334980 isoform X3 n=1 Tax=Aquila chrysaetos chrysaetos TaxID=223781 RepID=UPI001176C6B4|nr:uncharacterized protein LOC115334980 isoform X3 [Aquila chrysaetos chrysaetos]
MHGGGSTPTPAWGPGRFAGLWRPWCWCCWGISTGLRKEMLASARVAKAKQHLAAAVPGSLSPQRRMPPATRKRLRCVPSRRMMGARRVGAHRIVAQRVDQGVTPGSWEVTAGRTAGTAGQPKALLQTQPGYGRPELQDSSVEIKAGMCRRISGSPGQRPSAHSDQQ